MIHNLNSQPYPHWKMYLMVYLAKMLGIHFKIDGLPFGAPYGKRPDFDRLGADKWL